MMKITFYKELEQLINKHSIENKSNTPDFILAKYIINCLDNFEGIMHLRDGWHGNISKPGMKELMNEN